MLRFGASGRAETGEPVDAAERSVCTDGQPCHEMKAPRAAGLSSPLHVLMFVSS